MEDLGVYRGLVAYRTTLDTDAPALLAFAEVRDRAIVLVDGIRIGVLARERHERALVVPAGRELVVIVEDEGRVDYGLRIGERKGLIGPATLDGVALDAWDTLVLDVDALVDERAVVPSSARDSEGAAVLSSALDADRSAVPNGRSAVSEATRTDSGTESGDVLSTRTDSGIGSTEASSTPAMLPTFHRAEFDLAEPSDLFLSTDGWGKGLAWLNGFALGRYWSAGPQHTLYVPRGATRAGSNDLVILELDAMAEPVARFVADLELGHTEE
ncbi:hypothetical protein ACX9R5_03420 [Rathayibacter sp. CAU 1779]